MPRILYLIILNAKYPPNKKADKSFCANVRKWANIGERGAEAKSISIPSSFKIVKSINPATPKLA